MIRNRTLKEKILLRLSLKSAMVFMRNDFKDLAGYDQVGRALANLVKEKIIIKLGYGLYTKAKISPISGKLLPQASLPDLAKEALTKLKVITLPSVSNNQYNQGKSTQVPTGCMIAVQGRISRKIGYNGMYVSYERAAR